MPGLSPDTLIARRGDPLAATVDDELVMLDPSKSLYFGLDRVARSIWELLEEPRSFGSICEALEREFAVDARTCEADVAAFVEHMEEAELLEVR